jgi:hypothetical protein
MRKIIFTVPFYALAEPSHLTSTVVTPRGYKARVVAPTHPTSSRMISHRSSASFPMAEKKKIEKHI